jgi:hypothetical protein
VLLLVFAGLLLAVGLDGLTRSVRNAGLPAAAWLGVARSCWF